jgi:hypothetical protein
MISACILEPSACIELHRYKIKSEECRWLPMSLLLPKSILML